jgi:hypothetical protein
MARCWTVAGAAAPGLVLAGLGLLHPPRLQTSTAELWWQLHLVLLPLFPLLAVVLWVLLRDERGVLAQAARIAAYGFAVLYTGLDVLAGIAAGVVVDTEQSPSQAALNLGRLGVELGDLGVLCFLAATVLTGVVLVRRDGRRAVPGALVLTAAAVPFLGGHIYWPQGGVAMIGVAAGSALLAAAGSGAPAPATATAVAEPAASRIR